MAVACLKGSAVRSCASTGVDVQVAGAAAGVAAQVAGADAQVAGGVVGRSGVALATINAAAAGKPAWGRRRRCRRRHASRVHGTAVKQTGAAVEQTDNAGIAIAQTAGAAEPADACARALITAPASFRQCCTSASSTTARSWP